MNGLAIGLYGLYILFVGFNGNSGALKDKALADVPGFLPWAVSLGVLAAMYQNDATKKVAQPFLVLLILTFVLTNFAKLQTESQKLWNLSRGK